MFVIIHNEEAIMSDSSNPSVRQQNEGNETEPHGGASAASSLGAPAPVPDEDDDDSGTGGTDPDVHHDPDQVT